MFGQSVPEGVGGGSYGEGPVAPGFEPDLFGDHKKSGVSGPEGAGWMGHVAREQIGRREPGCSVICRW